MLPSYRTLTTPAFERDTRKILRSNARFLGAIEKVLTAIGEDPYNRSGKHAIKKLAGLKPGEGQWRIRAGDYRLRYDIFGHDVVLYALRHRKEAY
jgi:mRNA-degrading endonuclease RelE of RelBE toxin-antitoxin system